MGEILNKGAEQVKNIPIEEGFRMVSFPDVGDRVCYLGAKGALGTVLENGKIQTAAGEHTLFEREEHGTEVVFLRKYVDKAFTDLSEQRHCASSSSSSH